MLNTLIEKELEKFESQIPKNVGDELKYGYKVERKIDGYTEIFTITDWANIKKFIESSLRHVIERSFAEIQIEPQEIVLPENDTMNGKTKHDWEGQNLFLEGQQSALSTLHSRQQLFLKK
jgi:hypothetical protein